MIEHIARSIVAYLKRSDTENKHNTRDAIRAMTYLLHIATITILLYVSSLLLHADTRQLFFIMWLFSVLKWLTIGYHFKSIEACIGVSLVIIYFTYYMDILINVDVLSMSIVALIFTLLFMPYGGYRLPLDTNNKMLSKFTFIIVVIVNVILINSNLLCIVYTVLSLELITYKLKR